MIKKLCAMMVVIGICAGSSSANFVVNPGFEDQVFAEGAYYTYDNVQSYTNASGYHAVYVINPVPMGWGYALPNSGNNLMVLNAGVDACYVYQDSPAMVAGTTYELSAYVSNLQGLDVADYFLSLVNVRTNKHVGSITSDSTYAGDWPITIAEDATSTWTKITTPSYTATADDAGYSLRVAIWTWNNGGIDSYVAWDDIALVAVPEPLTLVLMSLGGLLYTRRK